MSLSPEIRKLKTLIGIDDRSVPIESGFEMSAAETSKFSPSLPELVALLQKQEAIISELTQELSVCKSDLHVIRQSSLVGFDANESILQSIQQNFNESNPSNTGQRSMCSLCVLNVQKCEELKRQNQHLNETNRQVDVQLNEFRAREIDAMQAVRKAVVVAESFACEKQEMEERLAKALQKIELTGSTMLNPAEKQPENTQPINRISFDSMRDQIQQLQVDVGRLTAELAAANAKLLDEKQLGDHKKVVVGDLETRLIHLQNDNYQLKLENDRYKQTTEQLERHRQESLEEFNLKLSETKQLYDSAQSDRSQMETHLAITRKHMQTHAERADRLLVELADSHAACARLQTELLQLRAKFHSHLAQMNSSIQINNDTTRAEYDHLVGEQKNVIHQLRHECETLLAEMKKQEANYRRKLRKAVEQNNELIQRMDVKLAQNISAGHKISDQLSDTTD